MGPHHRAKDVCAGTDQPEARGRASPLPSSTMAGTSPCSHPPVLALHALRSGSDLTVDVDFSVTVAVESADQLAAELQQILEELGLADTLRLE